MSFSRLQYALAVAVTIPSLLLLSGGRASAASPKKAKVAAPAAPPLLPADFSGWTLTGKAQESSNAQAADATSAAVLTEDGFTRYASATYQRDADKLAVRAIAFGDASGAYAAYTFYVQPAMHPETIGGAGAFDGKRVLFWSGSTVVDATFDRLTAMSAAELRDLAQMLPRAAGSAAVAPSIPTHLPKTGLDAMTIKYALGPVGYTQAGGVLPPELIDFHRGAEVVTAEYSGADGAGTMTLIDYPTPQIATDREQAIAGFFKAGTNGTWPQDLSTSSPAALLTRRSGPIVAVTSGNFPPESARKLLNQVRYEADVTWNNPKGYVSDVSRLVKLFRSIILLVAILFAVAIFLGLFLGGGRAIVRVLQGKPASALDETGAIIQLNLKD